MDFQPILSRHAVLNYISKYAAKAEAKSESYYQMLSRLSQCSPPDAPTIAVVRKVLTEIVGDRDIGAQETCHMLQKLPLVKCSRSFVSLNVKKQIFKRVSEHLDGEPPSTPFIVSYMHRPPTLEDLPLIEVARSWTFSSRRKKTPWKQIFPPMVVRVLPRFTSIPLKDSSS